MPKAARKTDIGSEHSCHFPDTPAIEGSPNVWINGLEALRVQDHFESHGCSTCPAPAHPRALADGSPNVYINGQKAGRLHDPIDCGGAVITGSENVFINGQ